MTVTENDLVLSEAEFRRISEVVYDHCGINLHEGKRDLVQGRIAKQVRVGGFKSATDYLDHTLSDPSQREFNAFIDSLSTNLTSFFREVAHFHHLTNVFLPALIARRKREGASRVRAWSAGCSTGEEPYSLVITLLEALEANHAEGWDVRLLATDLCTRVLKTAGAGLYAKRRVESIPAPLRARYVQPAPRGGGEMMSIVPEVRERIRFRYLNLMKPWPFTGPFDFIFCRNVMIYFDKPTQQTLVNRYWEMLEPGGLLFTGHSESLTGIAHKFKYVQPTIYQK